MQIFFIPVNYTQPIFNIEEIVEPDVASIINKINNSKAKDEFALDTNFIKLH